ncbi:aquaporin-4-like [Saccoglossus kowalevskii]|uniref:Aquaporin-4-like n=1 Tax=Saccoglossus kowalevskii TaxID=10224 RepID=A0ABM0GV23_SACKO|nr:PREDICTED: aquaporin-4-like [Saccoglossus kowalevskii]
MAEQTMVGQIRSATFWRAVLAECVAMAIFVFIGIASTINSPGEDATMVQIALGFGISIATMVQCFGHVSGAHINPAVTVAAFCTRKVNILVTMFYILAQCVGAIVGAALLYALLPTSDIRGTLGVTSIAGVHNWQGLFIEIILTFQLVLTIFATIDSRRSDLLGSASLSIGLSVVIGHLAGIRFTGASMNPARSFGPAVVMNAWTDHWVYWVGPIIGGVLAAFLYEFVFEPGSNITRVRNVYSKVIKSDEPEKNMEVDDIAMNDVKE